MRRNNKKFKKINKSKNNKRVVSRAELKFHDVALLIPVSTVAAIYDLSLIPNGVGANNRIGRLIYPTSLNIKLTLSASTTLIGSTVASFRMVIFQDLQQLQGTNPLMTDVMTPVSVTALRNIYYMRRFLILRDVVLKVDTYNPTVNFSNVCRMTDTMDWLGNEIVRRGLYVIFVSNNSTNPPNLNINFRLLFKDS